MTVVVKVSPTRLAERRYILDVVLSEWLGLDWRLEAADREDVRIELDGEAGGVTLPDVLLRTGDDEWLTPASMPPLPLPRVPVGQQGAHPFDADELLPVLYGARPQDPRVPAHPRRRRRPPAGGRVRQRLLDADALRGAPRRPARPVRPLPGRVLRGRPGGIPRHADRRCLRRAAVGRAAAGCGRGLRRRPNRYAGAADPRRGRPARHPRPHTGAAGPPVRGRPAPPAQTSGSRRAGPGPCWPPGAATTAPTRTTPSTSSCR